MVQTRSVYSKRTRTQRELDRARIAEMDRRGYTQYDMGLELGLTQSQVNGDLKKIRTRAIESQIRTQTEKIVELTNVLRLCRKEAIEAWELSKQPKTKTSRKSIVAEKASNDIDAVMDVDTAEQSEIQLVQVTREEETKIPDSRYLDIVLETVSQEMKLHGLDVIKPANVSNPTDVNWHMVIGAVPVANGTNTENSVEYKLQAMLASVPTANTQTELVDGNIPTE